MRMSLIFLMYDYVVDAVDTVTAKLEIIMRAKECNVPVHKLQWELAIN